jgi:hypothetical protein
MGSIYLVERHWLVKTSSGKKARLANRDKYLAEAEGTLRVAKSDPLSGRA